MAHIKCRYEKICCGRLSDMEMYSKPCNIIRGECGIAWDFDGWNIATCEAGYHVTCEFEKTVKNYEYISDVGANHLPKLRIGKRVYDRILYLEIDGLVMVEP